MAGYEHIGAINCNTDFDASILRDKTAIVTGGANGIGEAYVRALIGAGVSVCIGDLDVAGGQKLAAEFPQQAKFVKCDTTSWEEQVHLFESAASFSPTGKIHYVVANAGIIKEDEVFAHAGDNAALKKPDLTIMDINVIGSLYTTKLATHYFVMQNGQTSSMAQEDTCLILIGSGAAFLDCLRIPQYSASKWAMRGIMHALRRTAYHYGSRVNVISPWYVKTKILSEQDFERVRGLGVEFALAEDAARKWAATGYIDFDIDDYPENELIKEIQEDQMKGAEAEKGLFP
ncbi:hypothetical protein LTR51_008006 [Lithohypha guttulata]|nr:hypothetical protein LTR51_008006 [Lithohypha guttulata]